MKERYGSKNYMEDIVNDDKDKLNKQRKFQKYKKIINIVLLLL